MLRVLSIASVASAAHMAPVLKLRGGMDLGPITPELATNTFTTIATAQAVVNYIAPRATAEQYGVKKMDKMSEFFCKFQGSIMVSWAVMAWMALNGADTQSVFAWGTVPAAVSCLDTLLNKKDVELKIDHNGQLFNAAVTTVMLYSFFTGWNAEPLMKFYAAWGLANGINCAWNAEGAADMWGCPINAENKIWLKSMGYFMASMSTLAGSLVLGNDAATSIGYSVVPFALNLLDSMYVSKSFEEMGVDEGPIYGWMAVMGAVLATSFL